MKTSPLSGISHIFILILFVFLKPSEAQEKMVYGKIDPADMKMTHCPFDTSADAMVLGDIGSTRFETELYGGYVMVFERLMRIKIFTKNGYSHANWSIQHFNKELSVLKAHTYNLEGEKIVETKVTDESIFTEHQNIYLANTRFTFPAVKEGSIIEVKCTIRSYFFGYLRDWTFQSAIPARWSEYEVSSPDFCHYTHQTFGYIPFHIHKESKRSSANYSCDVLRLAVKDVPALKEEPYINSITNYSCRVEFVLHSIQFPGQIYHEINSSWNQIATDLMKDEGFGIQLNKKGVVKDLAKDINSKAKTPLDKMLLAFDNIRNMMKWDEHYSNYTSKTLDETFDEKTGNSADINLLLTLLMRGLGLHSDPVILSTRDHGLVQEYNVSLARMNHVICLVTIDNKDYLLDATQRLLPYTMLPFQCLNGQGLVVLPENARWIDLMTNEKNNRLFYSNLKVAPSGEISGSMQVSMTGYYAQDIRNACDSEGKEEYIKTLKKSQKNWELTDITIENLEKLTEPIKISYSLQNSDVSLVSADMIYLNTFVNLGQSPNDFLQEKRYLPVDFGCPNKESYVFTYEIPEGYAVESFPENVRLLLPDQAGSFKFMITIDGSMITVNSQMSMTRIMFLPGEYDILRNFFTLVIVKQSEQIVLKKI